jgi:hypothetical protein
VPYTFTPVGPSEAEKAEPLTRTNACSVSPAFTS